MEALKGMVSWGLRNGPQGSRMGRGVPEGAWGQTAQSLELHVNRVRLNQLA